MLVFNRDDIIRAIERVLDYLEDEEDDYLALLDESGCVFASGHIYLQLEVLERFVARLREMPDLLSGISLINAEREQQ